MRCAYGVPMMRAGHRFPPSLRGGIYPAEMARARGLQRRSGFRAYRYGYRLNDPGGEPMFYNFYTQLTYFAFLFGVSSGIIFNHNDTFLTPRRAAPGRKR